MKKETLLQRSSHWLRTLLRVFKESARSFISDDCYSKAATLTYYTVQSIVPLLAAILGFGKGFGLEVYLESLLTQLFSGQEEILHYVLQFADSMLLTMKAGVIAGVGIALLLWTNINLLGYIELALNQIWKVKTPRQLFQRSKDFIAVLVICPIVLVISSSLTLYFKAQFSQLNGYPFADQFNLFVYQIYRLVPFALSCFLFFLLYLLIPNTKMVVWPRLVGALIAGAVFQAWQLLYVHFQVQIFNYNVVYGTFAIIPLFFIWLQLSWLIALAGAEIAAHLELDTQAFSVDPSAVQKINMRELGFLILYHCLRGFYHDLSPVKDTELAGRLKIPIVDVQQMVNILKKGGILASVTMNDRDVGYHPSRDPNRMTLQQVVDVIDGALISDVTTESSSALIQVRRMLQELAGATKNSSANLTLHAFANRMD